MGLGNILMALTLATMHQDNMTSGKQPFSWDHKMDIKEIENARKRNRRNRKNKKK